MARPGVGLIDSYPDERAETVEHLDFAIREFQEMKMQRRWWRYGIGSC